MTKRIWDFNLDGNIHEVQLKFGLFSGRQIWLDGVLIEKGRNFFESGSEYYFPVDGHAAEIGIISTMTGYRFYLRIDGEFVSSRGNEHKKAGEHTAKRFTELQKWITFGNKYGLQYLPTPKQPFAFQHRFIGYINNFLTVIAFGHRESAGNSIPGFYILIRHAPIDFETAKEIKNNEEVKKTLKEMKIPVEWLEITSEFSSLFVSLGIKKSGEFLAIEKLLSFFHILSKKVRPSIADKCEGTKCASPYYKDLILTLINGTPFAMCRECIDRIDDIAKKAEEEYKKQPDNLQKGVLYGLVAMVIKTIVWALVLIFLDRIGAAFAILIFFFIVKAMDYAGTKRTFKSLLVASLLSLLGSIVGTYLGIAGYLLRDGTLEPTINELIKLAQILIEEPEMINETIVFALVGLIPYLFITWNTNRKNLNLYFKPNVELIENFKLRR
ncbi:MAG: hypothetical protein IPP66_06795 [Anaerolineales bacterium]|nr:hypothetical protein [Anaerolineales bacterium]